MPAQSNGYDKMEVTFPPPVAPWLVGELALYLVRVKLRLGHLTDRARPPLSRLPYPAAGRREIDK